MTRANLGLTSWFLPVEGIDAVQWATEAGVGHLHVDMTDVAQCKPEVLQFECRQRGISLSGLAVSWLEAIGVHGPKARKAVDYALSTALLLGISYVYLPSFGSASIRSSTDLRASANLLQYAADLAHDEGITIATENTLPAPALSKLFDYIDRDNVELLFDTQNLSIRGIDPLKVVESHGDRIRSFAHVKDGVGELGTSRLGAGTSSIHRSIRVLLSQGFGGIFVIESDYRTGYRADIEYDIDWLLRTMSGSDARQPGQS